MAESIHFLNTSPKTEEDDFDKKRLKALERRIGVGQFTIHGYLELLKLEPETKKAIDKEKTPFTRLIYY